MNRISRAAIGYWIGLGSRFLPFADAATPDLFPLAPVAAFPVPGFRGHGAGHVFIGTLNRVMIVELECSGVARWRDDFPAARLRAFRALIGYRSDMHRSALGWRRVPFMYRGAMIQFGGLAIMPCSWNPARPGRRRTGRGCAAVAGFCRAAAAFCWSAQDQIPFRPSVWRWRPTLRRRIAAQGRRPHVRDAAWSAWSALSWVRPLSRRLHARTAGSGDSGGGRCGSRNSSAGLRCGNRGSQFPRRSPAIRLSPAAWGASRTGPGRNRRLTAVGHRSTHGVQHGGR